jgi:hypothetical protein
MFAFQMNITCVPRRAQILPPPLYLVMLRSKCLNTNCTILCCVTSLIPKIIIKSKKYLNKQLFLSSSLLVFFLLVYSFFSISTSCRCCSDVLLFLSFQNEFRQLDVIVIATIPMNACT